MTSPVKEARVKGIQSLNHQSQSAPTSSNRKRWLSLRIRFWVPTILGGYLSFLALLTIPAIQTNLLYLYRVNIPFPRDLGRPEKYGFAPYKTRNFHLNTSDGESLGAWHVLPHTIYREAIAETTDHAKQTLFAPLAPFGDDVFEASLRKRDTVIYFHGNACNRATPHRVQSCMAFSNKLDVNVISIDYRGYGDSTGSPSEDGLLIDAQTVWDYVERHARSKETNGTHGEEGSKVVVVGHSLGTAVTSRLVGQLADRGVHPKAVVLIAPFTSLPELLTTYRLAGIPLISPLTLIPSFYDQLVRFLQDTWMSKDHLVKTKAPVLIIHARDDHDIPASHSKTLFELLSKSRSQSATSAPPKTITREGWGSVALNIGGDETGLNGVPSVNRAVAYFEADHGAHNRVGGGEGVMELMRAFLNSETAQDLEMSVVGVPSL